MNNEVTGKVQWKKKPSDFNEFEFFYRVFFSFSFKLERLKVDYTVLPLRIATTILRRRSRVRGYQSIIRSMQWNCPRYNVCTGAAFIKCFLTKKHCLIWKLKLNRKNYENDISIRHKIIVTNIVIAVFLWILD